MTSSLVRETHATVDMVVKKRRGESQSSLFCPHAILSPRFKICGRIFKSCSVLARFRKTLHVLFASCSHPCIDSVPAETGAPLCSFSVHLHSRKTPTLPEQKIQPQNVALPHQVFNAAFHLEQPNEQCHSIQWVVIFFAVHRCIAVVDHPQHTCTRSQPISHLMRRCTMSLQVQVKQSVQ